VPGPGLSSSYRGLRSCHGQQYLPAHAGLASGVTLGLAIGAGGLIAAALGRLEDCRPRHV
jgi:hypothetical protein